MAGQIYMPLQILKAGDLREFPGRDGRPAQKVRDLQCFTGDVVGTIPYYINDRNPDIQDGGHYMAEIQWSNYQGRLTPRVVSLRPAGSSASLAPASAKS